MNIYESFINIHHFVTHKQDEKTSKVRAVGGVELPGRPALFCLLPLAK